MVRSFNICPAEILVPIFPVALAFALDFACVSRLTWRWVAAAVALKSTLCSQHIATELPGTTMTCTLMCYRSRTDGFLVRIIRFFKAGSNGVLLDLYFFTGFLVSAVYIWITGGEWFVWEPVSGNIILNDIVNCDGWICFVFYSGGALVYVVVISISLWKTSDNIRTRLLNRSLFLQENTHYRWKGYREKNISGI